MPTAEKKPDTIEGAALPTFDPSKAAAEFRGLFCCAGYDDCSVYRSKMKGALHEPNA